MTSEKESTTVVIDKEDSAFYEDGAKYWEDVEPTVDGMLGGLGFLSDIDIKNSERFLKTLSKVLIQIRHVFNVLPRPNWTIFFVFGFM